MSSGTRLSRQYARQVAREIGRRGCCSVRDAAALGLRKMWEYRRIRLARIAKARRENGVRGEEP
jgi:hypothetical protein